MGLPAALASARRPCIDAPWPSGDERVKRIGTVFWAAVFLAMGHGAAAQTLRVGVRAAMTTADPASSFNPDRGITLQVFEPLLLQDADVKPVPGLAVSWAMRDPTTWAFTLRPGVVFSDGTPLTPASRAA